MLEDLDVHRMEGPHTSPFDCGRDMQNLFLQDRAWADQQQRLSTTYLFRAHGLTAGFATLCMDAVPLGRQERGPLIRYQLVSALKLAQLGIDHQFQGQGLGRWAVGFVVDFANELTARLACRYVTLDAQPELESWYTEQGFRRNKLHQQQRLQDALIHHRDPAAIAVSMRFDLREPA
jgi:GNAT superfamily N-acetyltransferase